MTSVINILIFIFYDIGNKHTDIHVVIQQKIQLSKKYYSGLQENINYSLVLGEISNNLNIICYFRFRNIAAYSNFRNNQNIELSFIHFEQKNSNLE